MATERQDKKFSQLPLIPELQGGDVLALLRDGVMYRGTITDILLSGQVEGLQFTSINAETGYFNDIVGSGTAKINEIIAGNYTTHTFDTGGFNAILGGNINEITGEKSAIVAGQNNNIYAIDAFIGAGINNETRALASAIVAGQTNLIESQNTYAFIGGGFGNDIKNWSTHSIIVGGDENELDNSNYSFIGGGNRNFATGQKVFIGGGDTNRTSGEFSVIVGGKQNLVSLESDYSFIGGGENNQQSQEPSTHSVIVGGSGNSISDGPYGVIVGGMNNTVSGQASFVGAGQDNDAGIDFSAIVAGQDNDCRATGAFIGAGKRNIINEDSSYSSILNGRQNDLTGQMSAILAGEDCGINANYSVILGGINTQIGPGGDLSIAFGKDALIKEGDSGCALFTDGLGSSSSGDNTFVAQYFNGIFLQSESGIFVDQLVHKHDIDASGQIAAGNYLIDFGRQPYETVSGLSTNLNFSYDSLPREGESKNKVLRIYTDGTARTFAFDESIKHIGAMPTGLSPNSMGVMEFTAYGPTIDQIVVKLEEES